MKPFPLMSLVLPLLLLLVPLASNAETNLGDIEFLCLDVESLQYLGVEQSFEMITIEHMGVDRSVFIYVPESASGSNTPEPLPMVVDIHGMGGCPSLQMAMSGWLDLATVNGFAYVAPLGITDPAVSFDSCWSLPGEMPVPLEDEDITSQTPECCCTLEQDFSSYADYQGLQSDVFLRKTIETLTKPDALGGTVTVDPKRVLVAGHSNGGVAAFAMAALHSDVVSGIAVHAGKLTTAFADDYKPIPVYMIHGEKDGDFRYGETVTSTYAFDAQEHIMEYIADKNGCAPGVVTEELKEEEGYVKKRTNCTNNADVTLLMLAKGGHIPYKGAEVYYSDLWGAKETVADTTLMACQSLFGDECAEASSRGSGSVASRTFLRHGVGSVAVLLMVMLL